MFQGERIAQPTHWAELKVCFYMKKTDHIIKLVNKIIGHDYEINKEKKFKQSKIWLTLKITHWN